MTLMALVLRFAALFGLLGVFPVALAVNQAGSSPGQFAVDANGAATYTIPIQVPPGINGLEPKLAITYNSAQGNGLLGVGASLSGLSSISRCAGSIATDGARKGISLTEERFCLDGQRLINVCSRTGVNCSGYQEYRTEIESFARIRAYGTDNTKPDYFKVWTKSGELREYGNTADSRHRPNNTDTLTWGVNKISDRKGNYLTVNYTSSSEFRPSSITYGDVFNASGAITAEREVLFGYESRADVSTKYVAGLTTTINQRLKTITTMYAGAIVRTYNFAYDQEASGASRSRLKTVTECGGGTLSTGDCYSSPIAFAHRASGSLGFTSQSAFSSLVSGSDYSKFNLLADMNGDGLTDIITANGTTAKVYLAKAGGGYNAAQSTSSALTAPTSAEEGISQWNEFADVNGDGVVDILRVSNTTDGTLQLRLGRVDGTFSSGTTLAEKARIDPAGFRYYNQVIDMNGDGLMDLVGVSTASDTEFTIRFGELMSGAFSFKAAVTPTGASFAPYTAGSREGFREFNQFADANGDGLVDVFQVTTEGGVQIRFAKAAADSSLSYVPGEDGGTIIAKRPWIKTNYGKYFNFLAQLVDVNSDGVLDIATAKPGGAKVATDPNKTYVFYTNRSGATSASCQPSWAACFKYQIVPQIDDFASTLYIRLGTGNGSFGPEIQTPGVLEKTGLTPTQEFGFTDTQIFELKKYLSQQTNSTSGTFNGAPETPCTSGPPVSGTPTVYTVHCYVNVNIEQSIRGISQRNQFADVNGDGFVDVVRHTASGAIEVAYGRGTGAFSSPISTGLTLSASVDDSFRAWNDLADLNGDGIMDIFTVSGTTGTPRISSFKQPSLVETITDGNKLVSKVTYAPLTNGDVYWITSGLDAYPSRKLTVPMYVVSRTETTDSTSAPTFNYAKQYRYKNLRLDYQRGWLGFAEVAEVDLNSSPTAPGYQPYNITTHTRYRQDYPFIGRPDWIVQTHSGDLRQNLGSLTRKLRETTISWNATTNTNVRTVFEDLRVEASNDPSDSSSTYATVITTSTDYQDGSGDGTPVDAYGNPEKVVHSNTVDGHLVTTTYTNGYDNSADFLGQLTAQSVTTTHATSTQGSQSRTVSRSFYADGLLDTEITGVGATLAKTVKYTYDTFGQVQSVTANGWDGSYDSSGNAQAVAEASRSVTYGYAKLDLRDWERTETITVNNTSLVTTTTIDGYFGLPKLVTDPNDIAAATNYDKLGRVISQVAYSGQTGQLTTTTSYGAVCLSGLSCAPGARLYVTVTPPAKAGATTITQYDALGREVSRAAKDYYGAFVYVDTRYDLGGRVGKVSNPRAPSETAVWTESFYDSAARRVITTAPNGARVDQSYAGLASTITRTTADEPSQSTTNTVDSQGNIIQVVDANGHATRFEYAPFGLLARVIPDTSSSRYTLTRSYDALGNLTSQADPDMGTWQYRYNVFGELKWQKDAKGQVTSFTYDTLGRMAARTEGTGTAAVTTTWTYDNLTKGKGLLDSVSRDGITVAYDYDGLKRPKSESTTINGTSYTVTTTYSATHGQVESVTYPNSGPTVKYDYFANGLLSRITNDAATPVEYWRANTYDARSQIKSETWGNLISGSRGYDPLTGALTSIKSGTGNNIQSLSYEYYQSGNLKLRSNANAGVSERFSYDRLNRLSSVLPSSGASISYDYDDFGNLKYKSGVGGFNYGEAGSGAGPHAVSSIKVAASHGSLFTTAQLQATVDDVLGRSTAGVNCELQRGHPAEAIDVLDVLCISKRIADSSAGGVDYSYTYDNNGNQLTGAGRTLTYTLFNKPATITANGATTTFTYGPDHERVVKRINSGAAVTTHTTVGGVYEKIVKSTGTEERFYIHAGSRLVAQVNKVGSTLTTHYAHTDLLGSVEALTVKSGTSYSIVETAGFAEFGQPRLGTWAQGNPAFTQTRQGYTGHEMDPESGLINMNARLYDPLIGRFVTADSVIPDVYDLQSLNRYSYVLNNPFGYTDPTGHVPYASGYDWNHGAGSGGTGPSLGATIVGNATGSWSGTGVPSPLPVAVPYANNVGMGLGSPLSLGMQPVAGMQGGNNEWQLDLDLGSYSTYAAQAPCHMECHGITGYDPGSYADWQRSGEYGRIGAAGIGITYGAIAVGAVGVAIAGAEGAAALNLLYGAQSSIATDTPFLGTFGSVANKTGTVWDSIKATQEAYPGTAIPRSFEMTAGQSRVWVHGNATEHLAEYAQSMLNRGVGSDLVNVGSQTQLRSLQAAVESATSNGIQYNRLINAGGWELKFALPRTADQLPALIHALPIR